MIFEDFFFYWIHRILHHPYIYEKIHKKHHRYLNLIHLNSVDAHPIEYFFGNFFTTISGSLVMGPRFHFITLLVFGFFRIIEGTETHCGYEFNFSMFKIYPFQIQNSYHSYHHIKNMGNYCIFFSIWDDIFRTNKNFYKAIKDVKMNNTENDKLY
jgi:sterol desaturase/sphingolipid hydroxylase (fatty acid hydroxylase superfamily)